MENPINDIEKWLPKGILQKGEDYFANDNVDNLERDGAEWVADVYGSEHLPYTVEVNVEGEMVTSWFCDCPYDYGPVCKHVAAVLLSIREEWTEEEKVAAPVFKKKSTQETTTNKKNSNPVTTIIEKLEESELRRLLHYFAGRHDVVKSHLLSNYADLLENISKAHFKNLVSSFIKANTSGRGNFIEYRQASQLGYQLTNLLGNDNSKSPMASVYLAEEVITQTATNIQHADDSSGSMGGAIAEGFLVLESFAEEENESPEEVVTYIFELAKKSMSLPVYQGWDWADNFRALAVTAARKKEDVEVLLTAFDQYIEKKKNEEGYSSKYDIEQTEKLKYQLIQEWYSAAEAEQYLQERLHFSSFRKMALEEAFAKKEFDTVLALAEAGVILDTETKLPGLVKEWQRWLIKYAETTGNNAKLIELNEKMFLDRGEMDYYRKLKTLMSPAAFKERGEKYIEHFRSKEITRWGPSFNRNVSLIYLEEARWEDLMKEIEKAPSLHLLDGYFAQLSHLFSAKYLELYEAAVRVKMDKESGRDAYKECCKYLQKIVHLGGKEQAEAIAADWKRQYPRRRAMMEELKKVGF